MVTRIWLDEYRHVPKAVKVGWFNTEIVLVLQQKYKDEGEYWSSDPRDIHPMEINKTGWANVEQLRGLPND